MRHRDRVEEREMTRKDGKGEMTRKGGGKESDEGGWRRRGGGSVLLVVGGMGWRGEA